MQKEEIGIREVGLLRKGWLVEKKVSEEAVNPPLTFQLKGLDPDHHYFTKVRKLKEETIEHFGLGYWKKGLMRGLVVIPIHDERGRLVAYADRYPSNETLGGKEKQKYPSIFKKHFVLYNLHRATGAYSWSLVLVKGLFDVFSLWEKGMKRC